MKQDKNKQLKICKEIRETIEDRIRELVIEEFRREEISENFYKYEVTLQDINFVTFMTNEEVGLSCKLTVDLLEELKEINNNGMNRQAFQQLASEVEKDVKDEVLQMLRVWNKINTEKMVQIFSEIERVRRIGGAWAMLIANPGLINAILVVYEKIVDNFDDVELYCLSAYFLLRAIMRMHSEEL